MTIDREPLHRPGSKAGRNEALKLTATALNNTGVALVLAALLQPVLAFLQQERPVSLAVVVASFIFLMIGGLLFWLARRAVRHPED